MDTGHDGGDEPCRCLQILANVQKSVLRSTRGNACLHQAARLSAKTLARKQLCQKVGTFWARDVPE